MNDDNLLILFVFIMGVITGWDWRVITIKIKEIRKLNQELKQLKKENDEKEIRLHR
jgi:hypothetical protein